MRAGSTRQVDGGERAAPPGACYQRPSPPQLMQTPVPLQVLQEVSPEPRKRPVPLQVLQRPDPPHGLQTELLDDELPPSFPS